MKLYVIGNGFDRHFRLRTGTDDFRSILANKKTFDCLPALEVFEGYGVNWGEYENSLADIDIDDLINDNLIFPNYSSDHESDRNRGIIDAELYIEYLNKAINDSLEEMCKNANETLPYIQLSSSDANIISPNSQIINFNYTSTVEVLYGCQCFHIHGSYDRKEKLVFGYCKSRETIAERQLQSDFEEDHDYYTDTQKEMYLELYHSWKKELRIDSLRRFLCTLNNIDEVIVLGHSISDVDLDYFELIDEILKPDRWFVSYYDFNDLPGYEKLSFCSKVQLFHF